MKSCKNISKRIVSTIFCSFLFATSSFAAKQINVEKLRRRKSNTNVTKRFINHVYSYISPEPYYFEGKLGNVLIENNIEDVFYHNILPFVDIKTWANLRRTCKYFKNITDREIENFSRRKTLRDALLDYATQGNLNLVKKIIISPKVTRELINLVLVTAAMNNKINVVNYLISNKKIRNQITAGSITCGADGALGFAALHGHINVVKLLLEHETTNYLLTDKTIEKSIALARAKIAIHLEKSMELRKKIDEKSIAWAQAKKYDDILVLLQKTMEQRKNINEMTKALIELEIL